MTSFGSETGNVLYLVVCAAPGAEDTLERVANEQGKGLDVCVVATERALAWFDNQAVEEATGHVIQSRMRTFGEPLFTPLGDSLLVAPASFNTINKIALGLADDMPTGLACEAIGRGVPVTIEARMGAEGFAKHPVLPRHIALLESAGVTFVWRDPATRPHFSGS